MSNLFTSRLIYDIESEIESNKSPLEIEARLRNLTEKQIGLLRDYAEKSNMKRSDSFTIDFGSESLAEILGFTSQVVSLTETTTSGARPYYLQATNRPNLLGTSAIVIKSEELESFGHNDGILGVVPITSDLNVYNPPVIVERYFSPSTINSVTLSLYDDRDSLYELNGMFYYATIKVKTIEIGFTKKKLFT